MLRFVRLLWNGFLTAVIDACRSIRLTVTPRSHGSAASSPALKLTYTDTDGLAQATIDTLDYGEVEFEDERLSRSEFDAVHTNPGPVLTIDDQEVIAQPNSILRYASKLSRTYSRDPIDAAIIDEWTEMHTNFVYPLNANMHPARYGFQDGYDPQKHHQYLLDTHIPHYLGRLEAVLSIGDFDDNWLGGMSALSMADVAWYQTLDWLRRGNFDGFDEDTLAQFKAVYKYVQEVDAQLSCRTTSSDANEEHDDTVTVDAAKKTT